MRQALETLEKDYDQMEDLETTARNERYKTEMDQLHERAKTGKLKGRKYFQKNVERRANYNRWVHAEGPLKSVTTQIEDSMTSDESHGATKAHQASSVQLKNQVIAATQQDQRISYIQGPQDIQQCGQGEMTRKAFPATIQR